MEPEDYLLLSGIQHFAFCKRQWALIHLEGQWKENVRTVKGAIVHERAHDDALTEKRGDILITRGLRVASARLGATGQLDVVEFHRSMEGARIHGWEGLWKPYPIEYKKGKPKDGPEDVLQLCAEAICLEEMLCCDVPEGCLFYDEIHRRENVSFDEALRTEVKQAFSEMHDYARRGYTPRIKPGKHCRACSLEPLCLPRAYKKYDVADYYARRLGEEA